MIRLLLVDYGEVISTCALQPIGMPPRSGIPSSAFHR
jgi:hypothetical protein